MRGQSVHSMSDSHLTAVFNGTGKCISAIHNTAASQLIGNINFRKRKKSNETLFLHLPTIFSQNENKNKTNLIKHSKEVNVK